MDTGLKQRLIGAAVLIALAVFFLPMLVKGPEPDSGVSDVSLTMPDAPDNPMHTQDLPLVTPGEVPKNGALGMDTTPVDRKPMAAANPTPTSDAAGAEPSAKPDEVSTGEALPLATAAGDYAVHFGAYATEKGAQTVVALAQAAQLPAYSEAANVAGKSAWRVRIGPYATRAEAESVRLKALEVRDDVPVQVVVLNAPTDDKPAPPAATAQTSAAVETPPAPAKASVAAPVVAKPAAKTEVTPAAVPAPKTETPKPVQPKTVATEKPVAPKPPAPKPVAAKAGFAVQVGAFGDASEANVLRDRLRGAGFTAFTETVNTDKGKLTRVRVGPVIDRATADQLKSRVKSKLGIDGIVRPHP